MWLKALVLSMLVALLFLGSAHSQDFEFQFYSETLEEGDIIYFNLSVLNPSLSTVSAEVSFISPDGIVVPFVFPPQDDRARGIFLKPAYPPGTGRVNNSETASLKDIRGETKFEWRTLYNGRVTNFPADLAKLTVDEGEKGNWTARVVVSAIDFERDAEVRDTFTASFNVTRVMSERNPKFIVFALSILTSTFTSVATYFMVDQKKARLIKDKVSAMQKEIMDAQRSGDKKRIAKAKRKQSEMMSMQSEMMRNQLKPMVIYMIPLFAVFYFLRSQFNMVPVAELPFKLGFMQFFHQNNPISPDQFGFIAWYFATATWFGTIFRKVLGVV
jgi:uncharacterized membrane protein (DUF106 family)